MPRIALLVFILLSTVLMMGCSEPTLKTTSDEAYKETLKKIFDAQGSEEKRMEISQGIVFVISNGSEVIRNGDSSNAYAIYRNLNFLGRQGSLMALDGKTAAEIIAAGNEARKKWVLENVPAQIADYKKRIEGLEAKKAETLKMGSALIPEARFREHHEDMLTELREEIAAAETELQKYK